MPCNIKITQSLSTNLKCNIYLNKFSLQYLNCISEDKQICFLLCNTIFIVNENVQF